MTSVARSVVVIIDQAPDGSDRVFRQMDAAMAAIAFDIQVSVVFVGAGTKCLLKDQIPPPGRRQSLSQLLEALPIYGITNILFAQDNDTPDEASRVTVARAAPLDDMASLIRSASAII